MLSNITITCFAASYAVTLTLEISRLFFRLRVRWLVMMAFAAAGWFAHSAHLVVLFQNELVRTGATPFSRWYDWCLLAAWVVAGTYLGLASRRPDTTVGVFLLPLVLALVGAGHAVRHVPPFPRELALSYWAMIHGVLLLLGTVAATLGFAAGTMYLLQSYQLKRKWLPRSGFRLPSLEWLQRLNRRSLLLSTLLLTLGLFAGLVLNGIRQSSQEGTVSWSDPVVISSLALLAWMAAASLFEYWYKPARAGRKVAYLTLASSVLLGLVLVLVLVGQHGIPYPPKGDGGATSPSGTGPAIDEGPLRGGDR